MKSSEKYQPIDCNLYDYLEEAAILKREVEIFYLVGNTSRMVKGIVTDLFIKDKAEHLRLNDKLNIRLDMVLISDGIDFKRSNNCGV